MIEMGIKRSEADSYPYPYSGDGNEEVRGIWTKFIDCRI